MIRFNEKWTYRTPLVTIDFEAGWEGSPAADVRKAALAEGVAEEIAAKAPEKPADGKR